jgi:mannose-1-phosphate guanylyltransferase
MAQYENVMAVILGGGAGSRLFPLTKEERNRQFRSAANIV